MFVTRKEIKKILKFIGLKDKAIEWLNQGQRPSEYKKDYELLFNNIKRSFICKGLTLDVNFKTTNSFRISNINWVNLNLELITFNFSYMKHLKLLKSYEIYYTTNNCAGLIPSRVDDILLEFSKQFLKDIDEQTKILERNFNFLKIRQGKREFNELCSKDEVLGEPFWRIRDRSLKEKDKIISNPYPYVDVVDTFATKEEFEELKKMLSNKELNSFFDDDGK